MVKLYIYILLLLLSLYCCVSSFYITIKYSPVKIKIFSSLVLLALIGRYFSLIIFYISQNIKYLYYFKPILNINFISIPLIYILCIFVFMRRDKARFEKVFLITAILMVVYVFIMMKFTLVIQIDNIFGYVFSIIDEVYIYYGYIIFSGVLSCFIIINKDKPHVNKKSMTMLLFIVLFAIVENILYTFGREIVCYSIVSEVLALIAMNLALKTFKKI